MNRSSSASSSFARTATKSLNHSTKALTNMFSITNTNTMKKLSGAAGVLALGIAALGLGGCGPQYDRTEISAVVPSPLSSNDPAQDINASTMTIPEGMILKAHIVVWNSDNVQMPLEIRCSDNSMIEVDPVVSDRDYAFIGLRAGTTTIQFFADNKAVVTIQAQVVPQPTPTNPLDSPAQTAGNGSNSTQP